MSGQLVSFAVKDNIAFLRGEKDMSADYGLTYDDVAKRLQLDPETGKLYWLIKPARNVPAGSEAGCVKATRVNKDGVTTSYRYVRVEGRNILASQIVWLLANGEWPAARLGFKDGDSLNLRPGNLSLSNYLISIPKFSKEDGDSYRRAWRKSYPMEFKDSQLRTDFGIGLAEYSDMLVAQDGKCAICNRPETEERLGVRRALSVDHNHQTGQVRGLLCTACNKAVGLINEDREVLLNMIKYLDKHAGPSTSPILQS
jgi:hypothetical protein